MELKDIIWNAAARTHDAAPDLEYNSARSWIDAGHVFMQGQEADELIEEARELYDRSQVCTMDDCLRCVLEPYLECLEN